METQGAFVSHRYDAVIAENESAQKRAGHWGVPLMVFNGEPFFSELGEQDPSQRGQQAHFLTVDQVVELDRKRAQSFASHGYNFVGIIFE